MKTESILGLNATRSLSQHTALLGLLGTIVVVLGSILFADGQTRQIEAPKINSVIAVPSDAELRRIFQR
jgi:hypothetical protein